MVRDKHETVIEIILVDFRIHIRRVFLDRRVARVEDI